MLRRLRSPPSNRSGRHTGTSGRQSSSDSDDADDEDNMINKDKRQLPRGKRSPRKQLADRAKSMLSRRSSLRPKPSEASSPNKKRSPIKRPHLLKSLKGFRQEKDGNNTKEEKLPSTPKASQESASASPPIDQSPEVKQEKSVSPSQSNDDDSSSSSSSEESISKTTEPSQSQKVQEPSLKNPPECTRPTHQPELHVMGEIRSGQQFGRGAFTCKWRLDNGSAWERIAGDTSGETQVALTTSDKNGPYSLWSHPFDLHYATTSFNGWPRLFLQVWQVDLASMATHVVGYGFLPLPFTSGEYAQTVHLWRPMGSVKEEMQATLMGKTIELVSDTTLFTNAWEDRSRLATVATGVVHVHFAIMGRHMDKLPS